MFVFLFHLTVFESNKVTRMLLPSPVFFSNFAFLLDLWLFGSVLQSAEINYSNNSVCRTRSRIRFFIRRYGGWFNYHPFLNQRRSHKTSSFYNLWHAWKFVHIRYNKELIDLQSYLYYFFKLPVIICLSCDCHKIIFNYNSRL